MINKEDILKAIETLKKNNVPTIKIKGKEYYKISSIEGTSLIQVNM